MITNISLNFSFLEQFVAALDKKNLGRKIKSLRKLELGRANKALISLNLFKDRVNRHSIDSIIKTSNLPVEQEDDIVRQSHKLLTAKLSKHKLLKSDSYVPPICALERSSCSSRTPLLASRMVQQIKM